MNAQHRTIDQLAALGVSVREYPHMTVYTGSKDALIGAGIATTDQFPTGLDGDRKWMRSGGYKGSSRNPWQRWKVTRHARGLFDVRRWHALRERAVPNLNDPGFQRFIQRALGKSS